MRNKITLEEFIERSERVHGKKYDYSNVEYLDSKTKVCIICLEHGEFWQTPSHHLSGTGCPKCSKNFKHTTESFIKAAKKIHGDLYDYSKVEYINNHTKVCIIDRNVGEFWQLPSNHLKGNKCYLTQSERVWNARGRVTTDDFIKKSKSVHGDKYDYSLVKYVDCNTEVEIKCKKCGRVFKQKPKNHFNLRHGCPFCNESKLEKEVECLLNEKKIFFERQKKFNWLGKQTLDFYLPNYNIGIECQGEQHYKPVDFGGKGKEWAYQHFQYNIKNDKIKKEKCKNNGVKILYYSKHNKKIDI